jgi:hypothetical protein
MSDNKTVNYNMKKETKRALATMLPSDRKSFFKETMISAEISEKRAKNAPLKRNKTEDKDES